MVAGLEQSDTGCPMHDLQLAGFDQVELSALGSLADDSASRRDLLRLESARHALDSDHTERRKERALLEECKPLSRDHTDAIQPAQLAPCDDDQRRQKAAGQK